MINLLHKVSFDDDFSPLILTILTHMSVLVRRDKASGGDSAK